MTQIPTRFLFLHRASSSTSPIGYNLLHFFIREQECWSSWYYQESITHELLLHHKNGFADTLRNFFLNLKLQRSWQGEEDTTESVKLLTISRSYSTHFPRAGAPTSPCEPATYFRAQVWTGQHRRPCLIGWGWSCITEPWMTKWRIYIVAPPRKIYISMETNRFLMYAYAHNWTQHDEDHELEGTSLILCTRRREKRYNYEE